MNTDEGQVLNSQGPVSSSWKQNKAIYYIVILRRFTEIMSEQNNQKIMTDCIMKVKY